MKQRSKVLIPTSEQIMQGSRAEKYWESAGFNDFLNFVRPNFRTTQSIEVASNPALLQRTFGINQIGFGNWVTFEDRYNYLNSLILCLYDLNKVVGFNNYVGLGYLSVSFGARGSGSALAHYEPDTKIINITRYREGDSLKVNRFIATGGMGSFAHEYGHFLDYVGGELLEPSINQFSLTGGRSIDKSPLKCYDGQNLRIITNEILSKIIWEVPNRKLSAYYLRMVAYLSKKGVTTDYYYRRNELFARWFEAWVNFRLQKLGIRNRLLTDTKYTPNIYPTEAELRNVDKYFEAFCKVFGGYINKR